MRRAIVYIDGFNFYYGAVKGTPYKWLDLSALAQRLMRGHRIDRVRYFTARVQDRADDPGVSQRQDTYLRALATRPKIDIAFGQFRTNRKPVPLDRREPDGTRRVIMARITEEKGSDVSLGAHLVWDACHGSMDVALVVSNDSDLQVPVDMASRKGVEVVILNPHRHDGHAAQLQGNDRRQLRLSHLKASQLPDPVVDGAGRRIHKPPAWA